jgi:hypothetical protein
MSEGQVVFCDKFPDRYAVAHFRWAWGEEGKCCAEYQFLLRQQADNMGQQVQFSPIVTPPAPMGRDERAMLKGQVYALEAELTEVRAQMHSLYNETEKLRSDARIAATQEAAAKQLLSDAQVTREDAILALGEAEQRAIQWESEARRLRALLPDVGSLPLENLES